MRDATRRVGAIDAARRAAVERDDVEALGIDGGELDRVADARLVAGDGREAVAEARLEPVVAAEGAHHARVGGVLLAPAGAAVEVEDGEDVVPRGRARLDAHLHADVRIERRGVDDVVRQLRAGGAGRGGLGGDEAGRHRRDLLGRQPDGGALEGQAAGLEDLDRGLDEAAVEPAAGDDDHDGERDDDEVVAVVRRRRADRVGDLARDVDADLADGRDGAPRAVGERDRLDRVEGHRRGRLEGPVGHGRPVGVGRGIGERDEVLGDDRLRGVLVLVLGLAHGGTWSFATSGGAPGRNGDMSSRRRTSSMRPPKTAAATIAA